MKIYKYLGIAAFALMAVSCSDDDDINTDGGVDTDFSGTFAQEDQMGRPGINTVFTTSEMQENDFNLSSPQTQIANWQPVFQGKVEALYNAYGASYENNILQLDAPTLTTALALDVLQVAPDGTTAYFDPSTGIPLTGRTLEDDVIDVSLTLLFGGNSGTRFNGDNGTPNLVSDNVDLENGATSDSFPYLTPANF